MVFLPGGRFRMGSDDHYAEEKSAHWVKVDGFSIDPTPVTNAQFRAFVEATGHVTVAETAPDPKDYPGALPNMLKAGSLVFSPPDHPVNTRDWTQWWEFRFRASWRRPYGPGSSIKGLDDHPAVHIAYADAQAYALWAGKQLPTEAEWEFAATRELVARDANLDGRHRGPVAAATGGEGASHMIGNVWEWTASAFAPYPGFAAGPYADYSQPWFGDHHVIRGGSWATRSRLVHPRMRNFYRPERSDMFVGFRTCAPR